MAIQAQRPTSDAPSAGSAWSPACRFDYLGSTTREIRRNRLGYHPVGTDVVVDWQSPKEEGGLSGGVVGIGGHWVQGGRRFDGYVCWTGPHDSRERPGDR